MLNLSTCTSDDVNVFGRTFFNQHRDALTSFEGAAQLSVNYLYNEIVDGNHQKVFALVRLFRIGPTTELPTDIQIEPDAGSTYWVTLAGTVGDQPEWCDRHQSIGHQAIPEKKARQAPMLKAVFDQLGLKWGDQVDDKVLIEESSLAMVRYFHIPKAMGSPYVVAQDEFVKPYSIQSVIGVGGIFLSRNAYALVGFSKAPIDRTTAEKFVHVAPYLSTLLAIYEQRQLIWQQ